MKKVIIGIIVAVLVIVFSLVYFSQSKESLSQLEQIPNTTKQNDVRTIAEATYYCDGDKTIQATYQEVTGLDSSEAKPEQIPQPTGSLKLTFAGDKTVSLAQTISASGARYENKAQSLVFWSKGSGALVLENDQEDNYTNCIEVAKDNGTLPQVYANGADGYSARYPKGYTALTISQGDSLAQNATSVGVKFTIDPAVASGTNLSSDSYVSIEKVEPVSDSCSAIDFLLADGRDLRESTVTANGKEYSVASSTDAGAGNRYEQWVYAIPGSNPCRAVRYYIHYSVFENYPAGMVERFDKTALINTFDSVRDSLILE